MDKLKVHRLRDELHHAGHRPWLEEGGVLVGESIPSAIERALAEADYLVFCLSIAAKLSGWVEAQQHLMTMRQYAERHARILPVRLEEVAPPTLLSHIAYVDLFPDDAWKPGLSRLLTSIEAHESRLL